MITQSDFHYEILIDIIGTAVFTFIFVIIYLLNSSIYYSSKKEYHSSFKNYQEQNNINNIMINIMTSTTLSS